MEFGLINRRHHCRACGGIFCSSCSLSREAFPHLGYHEPVRCCNPCATIMHEQRQRPARGPPAQAGTSEAPPAHTEKGKRVQVFGLEAKPEYNDQLGTVTLWDDERKRAGVLLDSGTKIALKPANLRAAKGPPAAAALSRRRRNCHPRLRHSRRRNCRSPRLFHCHAAARRRRSSPPKRRPHCPLQCHLVHRSPLRSCRGTARGTALFGWTRSTMAAPSCFCSNWPSLLR